MKCPNCEKLFNDKEHMPLNLTCGHSFCKACLKGLAKADGILECKICLKKCPRKVQELSKNFIALNLGCDLRESQQKFRPCAKHPGEHLRFFCEDCDVIFCPLCIVDHPAHAFAEVKFSIDGVLRKIAGLKELLQGKSRALSEFKERVDAQCRQLEQSAAEEVKGFDDHVARLAENVRQVFQRLTVELQSKFSRQEHLFEKNVERVLALEGEVAQLGGELDLLGQALEAAPEKPLKIKNLFERANAQKQSICDLKQKESFSLSATTFRFNAKKDAQAGSVAYVSKTREEPVMAFFGEEKQAFLYRLHSDSWETVALPEEALPSGSGARCVFISASEVLFTGGYNSLRAFSYNLKTQVFTPRKSMLWGRTNHGIVALKGRVLVFSGYSAQEAACTLKCEAYDVELDRWSLIADIGARRQNFGCAALGEGRVVVCGGVEATKVLGSVEVYDVTEDVWSTLQLQLPGNLLRCRAFAASPTTAYIFGHSSFHGNFEAYLLDAEKAALRPVPGLGKKTTFAHCQLFDGDLLLFGGKEQGVKRVSLASKRHTALVGYRGLSAGDLAKALPAFSESFPFESIVYGKKGARFGVERAFDVDLLMSKLPTIRAMKHIYPFSAHSDSLLEEEELFSQDSLMDDHMIYNPIHNDDLRSDIDEFDEL